jgi:hypothetical protein
MTTGLEGVRGVRRTPLTGEKPKLGIPKKTWSLQILHSRAWPLPGGIADVRGYAYPRYPPTTTRPGDTTT